MDIFLLSKDGLILVGPDKTERTNIADVSKNVAETFKGNEPLYKTIMWDEESKYLTASSVSFGFEEYKGFSWKVIVRQPVDKAFKIANDNTSLVFYISLIAGLLGALIGIIISNIISNPLKKLSQIVDNLRENKKVDFLEKVSNDDIGKLHNAIENLYKSLNDESKLKEDAQNKVNLSLKVFEQALEGIIITDDKNNIILVNKAFTDITGYQMDEVYGKNPSMLGHQLQDEEFYKDMWNSIETKGKWDGLLKNRKKDGTIYEEYLKISSLKDENGKVINYLATFNSGF